MENNGQNSGNRSISPNDYAKRILELSSREVTPENVETFVDDALQELVEISTSMQEESHTADKWAILTQEGKLEDTLKNREDYAFEDNLPADFLKNFNSDAKESDTPVGSVLNRLSAHFQKLQQDVADCQKIIDDALKDAGDVAEEFAPSGHLDAIHYKEEDDDANKIQYRPEYSPRNRVLMTLLTLQQDFGVDIKNRDECHLQFGNTTERGQDNKEMTYGYAAIEVALPNSKQPDYPIHRFILVNNDKSHATYVFDVEKLDESDRDLVALATQNKQELMDHYRLIDPVQDERTRPGRKINYKVDEGKFNETEEKRFCKDLYYVIQHPYKGSTHEERELYKTNYLDPYRKATVIAPQYVQHWCNLKGDTLPLGSCSRSNFKNQHNANIHRDGYEGRTKSEIIDQLIDYVFGGAQNLEQCQVVRENGAYQNQPFLLPAQQNTLDNILQATHNKENFVKVDDKIQSSLDTIKKQKSQDWLYKTLQDKHIEPEKAFAVYQTLDNTRIHAPYELYIRKDIQTIIERETSLEALPLIPIDIDDAQQLNKHIPDFGRVIYQNNQFIYNKQQQQYITELKHSAQNHLEKLNRFLSQDTTDNEKIKLAKSLAHKDIKEKYAS